MRKRLASTMVLALALATGCDRPYKATEDGGPVAEGLATPFLAMAAGEPIRLSMGHAAPILADLDRDGMRDLVIGEFEGGGIRFYRNVGSPSAPKFDAHTMLSAGGQRIAVEYG
jgi:hypothetical protein